ncbi:M57 family metalloprotease [Chitinophaga sp. 30R24]|uniref:M57 family metalloprotease n=1 Tax=Chitinophaga sp. 30R24 TaxID=3248838 RepID=UPI003B90F081
MKTTKCFLLLALCAAAIFSSCKKSEVKPSATPDEKIESRYLIRLYKLGFDTTRVKSTGAYIVTQGDYTFAKSFLDTLKLENIVAPEVSKDATGRHASTNTLLTKNNIVIYLPKGTPTFLYNEVTYALGKWNLIPGSNLNFYITYNGEEPYDWKIINQPIGSGNLAVADFPGYPDANGVPGYNIIVDEAYISTLYNTVVRWPRLVRMLMHEMGHMVGLRHTDWDAIGEGQSIWGANYIPGTPTQDPASVFNGFYNPNSPYVDVMDFSAGDITAISNLYPLSTCNLQGYVNLYSHTDNGELNNVHRFAYPAFYERNIEKYALSNIEVQITGISVNYTYNYNGPIPEDGFIFPNYEMPIHNTYRVRMRYTNLKGCLSTWGEKVISYY